MTVEQLSACTSKIRGKDTKPERFVHKALSDLGLEPETQVRDLSGRPDFVLRHLKLAIFVDGDFWHGWRFPVWQHKLKPFWHNKISSNRARDRRNHIRFRREGWQVLRIWEHQIERNPAGITEKLADACRQEDRGDAISCVPDITAPGFSGEV